jgi:hypothetical protein
MHPDEERFAEKIRIEGDCWIWTGSASPSRQGTKYAHFWAKGKHWRACRWAYEFMIGEIPEGLTLDHLCRNTLCVNPYHCEPVTLRENILRGFGPTAVNARKLRCIHGHELAGANLYVTKTGKRQCKECQRRISNASLKRRAAAGLVGYRVGYFTPTPS